MAISKFFHFSNFYIHDTGQPKYFILVTDSTIWTFVIKNTIGMNCTANIKIHGEELAFTPLTAALEAKCLHQR